MALGKKNKAIGKTAQQARRNLWVPQYDQMSESARRRGQKVIMTTDSSPFAYLQSET